VLSDSSKRTVEAGAQIAEQEPKLFPSLMELAFRQSGPHSMRATRVVVLLIERRPDLFGKYIEPILQRMESIHHESVKFNMLKIFTFCDLPEDEDNLGKLTNLCFDAVEANVSRIAIKVYAIEILYRISQIEPELKHELLDIIEKYMMGAQAAFLSRGIKITRKLRKELGLIDVSDYEME
jgi:hypothetical protein